MHVVRPLTKRHLSDKDLFDLAEGVSLLEGDYCNRKQYKGSQMIPSHLKLSDLGNYLCLIEAGLPSIHCQ